MSPDKTKQKKYPEENSLFVEVFFVEKLKELNMTLDDLIELMRGCNVFKIEEIAYAIIETNGNLSIGN